MDSGYYAACAAWMSRAQALETVANNLANSATSGYRAEHNIFRSVLAAQRSGLSPVNQAMNDYGVLGGTRLDLTQGALERTGGEHDLAIEGPGFFVVQTPTGRVFTRSGNFHVSQAHQLVTAEGDPVMGDRGILTVLDGPMSVSQDGTISVNGAVAGRLKVVEFPLDTTLQSMGKTYYSAPTGSESAAQKSSVRQGVVEASNVDAVANVVDLITVQRSADMMQKALSMFHSELNRIATQDLPRVSS